MKPAITIAPLLLSLAIVDGARSTAASKPPSTTPSALPTLLVQLTPRSTRTDPEHIDSLDVELAFERLDLLPAMPLARIAKVADNVDTVATTVTNLSAKDDHGPLALQVRDTDLPTEHARDSETGGATREWYTDRPVSGRVVLRYSVPARATLPPRGPAPPLEFKNDDGAISAAGNVFLIMPPGNGRYRTNIRWDLSNLPSGARGISSLGEGVASNPSLSSSELRMTYFMAGKLSTLHTAATKDGFFAAWQGRPTFDAPALMEWTGNLHERYIRFFDQKKQTRYGVFLRFNPVNAGGGTGFFRSFVLTYGAGKGSNPLLLKFTLAHEMFHTFQPFITSPAGKVSSWFGEGLAVFYQSRLPLRYGLIEPQQFIDDINYTAARYYSNPYARLSNQEAGDGFWKETRIRTLAYDRGMLYFAMVDEMVKRSSMGKVTLDQMMMEMLRRQNATGSLTNLDWEAVLKKNIGDEAVSHFHRFLAGEMPVPSSSAFGSCFARTTKRVRRYEVGFDPTVLGEQRRVIRGLVAGSTAAAAGLQNGDEIMKPVPQDVLQGSQGEFLTLEIGRGPQRLTISYLPRGDDVEVYQWYLKTSLKLGQCTK